MTSFPRPPQITSRPGVPLRTSLRGVPWMVHVGAHACASAAATSAIARVVTSTATVLTPARWFPLSGYRGRRLITLVLDSRETSRVLAALLRRREEVEAWMDGPAKKA